MFGIAGTVELGTICPGTGTWNRLQDGTRGDIAETVTSDGPGSSISAHGA